MTYFFFYLSGIVTINLLGFYFIKGVFNLIKLKRIEIIFFMVIFTLGASLEFNYVINNHNVHFFWHFATGFILGIISVLLPLRFAKKNNKSDFDKKSSIKKATLLLFIALLCLITGLLLEDAPCINILLLIIYMYTFLIGAYHIIRNIDNKFE